MFPHGENIKQKLEHKTKYLDKESKSYLEEILPQYEMWKSQNMAITGTTEDDIKRKVDFLNEYKDFIDQQKYAEKFDSRSNLHSTALEEFLYYLFKDAVPYASMSPVMGRASTFKGIYFSPKNFEDLLKKPGSQIEIKDQDFIIGSSVLAQLSCPGSMSSVVESHEFRIPAVTIEVKTYLDKTMLEGASASAEELKRISPGSKYYIVAEYLKLTTSINLFQFKVDQIYVLRRQKNIDREFRFLPDFVKNPIYPDLIYDLFKEVVNHLSAESWELDRSLERGKLL